MRKYLICTGFCGIFAAWMLRDRGISWAALSDGFAVPGMLLLCAGALLRLHSAGALEGLGRLWRSVLFPGLPPRPRRRSAPNTRHLILTGALSITAAMIFLALSVTI